MLVEEYMIRYDEDARDRLEEKLAELRQVIIQSEKSVLLDGRFERMIISPLATISIAMELINELAIIRRNDAHQPAGPAVTNRPADSDYPQTT